MHSELTIKDAAACVRSYPTIGEVATIVPMTGAFHNTLFRVFAAEGEFYLKVLTTHATDSTEARYEFLDWAMEQFRRSGVDAPVAIWNKAGTRLTACGSYPAVLSAAVRGDEFHEERLPQQRSVGSALRRFHLAAARSTPRGFPWLRPLGGYLLRDESQLNDVPDVPETPAVRQWFPELLARSTRIARELEACGYAHLPRSAVHSEVTGKHLKVRGDEVCGVIDFEYACLDARVIDVGRSLTCLFCIGPEAEEDGPARTRAFLRGYNSAGWSLEPEELAAIPTVVKAWDFECITFFIHQLIETQASIRRFDLGDRIPEWLQRVNWWEQHGMEVAEQLMRVTE